MCTSVVCIIPKTQHSFRAERKKRRHITTQIFNNTMLWLWIAYTLQESRGTGEHRTLNTKTAFLMQLPLLLRRPPSPSLMFNFFFLCRVQISSHFFVFVFPSRLFFAFAQRSALDASEPAYIPSIFKSDEIRNQNPVSVQDDDDSY